MFDPTHMFLSPHVHLTFKPPACHTPHQKRNQTKPNIDAAHTSTPLHPTPPHPTQNSIKSHVCPSCLQAKGNFSSAKQAHHFSSPPTPTPTPAYVTLSVSR